MVVGMKLCILVLQLCVLAILLRLCILVISIKMLVSLGYHSASVFYCQLSIFLFCYKKEVYEAMGGVMRERERKLRAHLESCIIVRNS